MLAITLDKIGKRFGREWIFRNVQLEFPFGSKTVILGGNGSGKSTLLQIISGFVTPSEGKVQFSAGGKPLEEAGTYRHVSLAAPYLQLIEDFTGLELAAHLQSFKPYRNSIKPDEVLRIASLQPAADKLVRHYSSGMKQRLKLALAILADTPLLLLDEPASNLDAAAIKWYTTLVEEHCGQRTVIVCSNAIEAEYAFCDRRVQIADHKNPVRVS